MSLGSRVILVVNVLDLDLGLDLVIFFTGTLSFRVGHKREGGDLEY